jgi:catechol 2,3-dioxygenase-like lactoylglutathione lyase family enzyme
LFVVDDIDAVVADLRARGTELVGDAVVADLRARGTELVGEVVRYEDSYRLCYVRGPEGIIVELAEKIG